MIKMNKVIFLDRDGTIIVDYGYVHSPSQLLFITNAIDGLKILSEIGYKLIIVTNQSGIGRNKYTIKQYEEFNNYFITELLNCGIEISKVYYCPHTDEDNCDCRKPKIGLFEQAIKEFDIDLNASFAIGDNERDLSICDNSNVKGILLGHRNDNYFFANDLFDAATQIKAIAKE